MQLVSIVSLMALATLGVAVPAAVDSTIPASQATAYNGAVGPTTSPRPKANLAPGPSFLTVTIINRNGAAISTGHARATGAPTPVGGPIGPGTIANGATASFAVPTGFIGNVALVPANYPITGDDSLIEFNYVVPSGYSYAVADVDISYVNGFSVPITCACSGTVVTGCNKNLFALHACGNNPGQGACVNPNRANTGTTSASPFFAPCQGAAYTFPNDNGANSFGQCQSGQITCCVGTACPANPKQPA